MSDTTVSPSPNYIEEWEESLKERYPETESEENRFTDPNKPREAFRNYEAEARPTVREFYRLNHTYQTVDFVRAKKTEYLALDRREMGIWEAMEYLNTLVDDSDPDTDLTQIQHLLQTSEEIRKDGHPRWFVLAGLVHDLGKILCLYGEPQWAVVGDTFPVGCAYSDKIVFSDFFDANPDSLVPEYQTENGIYEPGCGLDNVHLSWGHDEYIYQVTKDYLPEEALYMLRYHSFYPWHKENAYSHLTNEKDREMLRWVRAFNPYDLYSKSQEKPNVEELRPYYEDLIAEYFPPVLKW
ncbi:MAG: inositol oxygenase family protein [Capsulimonadales bacterium]|nr:inositol oxygenase family protein [Capsulimonadales bacterium]